MDKLYVTTKKNTTETKKYVLLYWQKCQEDRALCHITHTPRSPNPFAMFDLNGELSNVAKRNYI